MPKCGEGEEGEETGHQDCNVKCIPNFAQNTACITKKGVEEKFSASNRTIENWDCPACAADTESEDEESDEEYLKRGRTFKRPDRGGDKAARRALRDAKRYQPWTPYYIGTVMLEKLVQMVSLGSYIYSDNYRWGLLKSFVFFAIGVKSMFSLAEFISFSIISPNMNALLKTVTVLYIFSLSVSSTFGQLRPRCSGGVECINLEDCTGLYNQLQRGTNPRLTALLRGLHCGFNGDTPMICCPPEFQGVQNDGSTSASASSWTGNTNGGGGNWNRGGASTNTNNGANDWDRGGSANTNGGNGWNNGGANTNANGGSSWNGGGGSNSGGNRGGGSSDPSSLLPNQRECGIQNNDRIVGGSRTDIDEHPWMALLRYDKPVGWGFYCGGVLIASRYVLTAAHCVKGEDLPSTWRL
ncbi:trypsin domain-containing protein [Phthorimaea operculella]|nr:trypsin domain-containing protein [Phthorimaea operculella]